MKALASSDVSSTSLMSFLKKKIRRKGVLRRGIREDLTVYPPLWRPFRLVHWELEDSESAKTHERSTLLDENLMSLVSDLNERYLLWRPRYSEFKPVDIEQLDDRSYLKPTYNENELKEFILEFLAVRKNAQNGLMELGQELRGVRSPPQSSMSFLIPRLPSQLRKQDSLEAKLRTIEGVLLATSIVANCNANEQIVSGHLGDSVFVETILAEYIDLIIPDKRFVFLETPGATSAAGAAKSGRALGRLCQTNKACRQRTLEEFRRT